MVDEVEAVDGALFNGLPTGLSQRWPGSPCRGFSTPVEVFDEKFAPAFATVLRFGLRIGAGCRLIVFAAGGTTVASGLL